MNIRLKQFLQAHRKLIEQEKYDELYFELARAFPDLNSSYTRELSEFLISCDFDPLIYVKIVPIGYLNRSSIIDHVLIPDNIEHVGRASFMYSEIKSVTFNNTSKCKCIDSFAFEGCDYLESVILPPSCTTIRSLAFNRCSSLTSVIVNAKNVNMSADVFTLSPKLTVYCHEGGSVEDYCIDNNIDYRVIGEDQLNK